MLSWVEHEKKFYSLRAWANFLQFSIESYVVAHQGTSNEDQSHIFHGDIRKNISELLLTFPQQILYNPK